MTTDEIVRQLEPWRARHRRPAFRPITKDGDASATASKFSGTPWLGENADWPTCSNCKKPPQLFLQLNLETLPKALGQPFGAGLLQLFYCTRDECAGMGGWEPFGDDLSRIRVVQPTGPSTPSSVPSEPGYLPAKQIVGWKEITDLPHPEEHEQLGLKYIYDHKAGTVRLECESLGLAFDEIHEDGLAEKVGMSEAGDKLSGWPYWIQSIEYPACPKCTKRMALVFQLDSNDNLPFMFGDVGCGHITQCPEHKDVVAFGWACG
jgi:uncharacterized protein YwqG